jgi:hypothetical protein
VHSAVEYKRVNITSSLLIEDSSLGIESSSGILQFTLRSITASFSHFDALLLDSIQSKSKESKAAEGLSEILASTALKISSLSLRLYATDSSSGKRTVL